MDEPRLSRTDSDEIPHLSAPDSDDKPQLSPLYSDEIPHLSPLDSDDKPQLSAYSDSDDEPTLSAHTLAALNEFYAERDAEINTQVSATGASCMPNEDWQLSQFWYDDETSQKIAEEAMLCAGENGRIACISAPSAYKKITELNQSSISVTLFEFDRRFECSDFVFYDYNKPLDLDKTWKNHFDVVIVDPPFLSEECLCKTAITLKFVLKEPGKIILCTGATQAELARRLLDVKKTDFLPRHKNQLQNEFWCYTNFQPSVL